ncbi:unnamed protein product [Trichobilharzia szidati]|nr:unnamed protein product [Trichobilharzia szidati]
MNTDGIYDTLMHRQDMAMHKPRSKSKRFDKEERMQLEMNDTLFSRSASAHPILMNPPQLPPKVYKGLRERRHRNETPERYHTIGHSSHFLPVNTIRANSPAYAGDHRIIEYQLPSHMTLNRNVKSSNMPNSHSLGHDISLLRNNNNNNEVNEDYPANATNNHQNNIEHNGIYHSSHRKHGRGRRHKHLDSRSMQDSDQDKLSLDVKSMKSSLSDWMSDSKTRSETVASSSHISSSGLGSYNGMSTKLNGTTSKLNSIYENSGLQNVKKINSADHIDTTDKQFPVYASSRNISSLKKSKTNSRKNSAPLNQVNILSYDKASMPTTPNLTYSTSCLTMKPAGDDILHSSNIPSDSIRITNHHMNSSQSPVDWYSINNANVSKDNNSNDQIMKKTTTNRHSTKNYDYKLHNGQKSSLHRSNSSGCTRPRRYQTSFNNQQEENPYQSQYADYYFPPPNSTIKHPQASPFAFNHRNDNNVESYSNNPPMHYTSPDIRITRNQTNFLSPMKHYNLNRSDFQIFSSNHQNYAGMNGEYESVRLTDMIIDENAFCLLNSEEFRNELGKIVTPGDPRADLHEICRIGKGSTGVVYLMRHSPTKHYVAVKKMNIFKQQRRELLFNEVIIMQTYPHPNIVEMFGSYLIGNELWVAMEYLEGGALTNIVTRTLMSEKQIATVCRDVLRALAFLHDHGIIHRDVKSDSILLSIEGRVKLSDFGFCARVSPEHPRRRSLVGTPYWMSPEVISRLPYNTSVDVWSMGVLLIEMVDGEPSFFNEPPLHVMRHIQRDGIPHLMNPHKSSRKLNSFLGLMLVRDPLRRATAAQLLLHPFLLLAGSSDCLLPLLYHSNIIS